MQKLLLLFCMLNFWNNKEYNMFGWITSLRLGFWAPFKGLSLILKNRKLFVLSLVPMLINTLLYCARAFLTYKYFGNIVSYFVQDPSGFWGKLFYGLVYFLLLVAVFLLFVFSFTVVGNILLSPFSDALAGQTEIILRGKKGEESDNFSFSDVFFDAARIIKVEIKKALFISVPFFVIVIVSFLH